MCGSTGHLFTESRVITTLDDVPQSRTTDSWTTAVASFGAAAAATAARKGERGDSPDPDRLRGDSPDLNIVFLRLWAHLGCYV